MGSTKLASNSVVITYDGRTTIDKIRPSLGLSDGGTRVTVIGKNFTAFEEDDIFCEFGQDAALVPANVVSNEELQCISPPLATNNFTLVSLKLTNVDGNIKGNDYGLAEIIFQYYATPSLTKIIPDSFPSGAEKQVILQINGNQFIQTDNITCHVGNDVVVPATFVRSTLVECGELPSLEPGSINIGISFNGGIDISTGAQYLTITPSVIIL